MIHLGHLLDPRQTKELRQMMHLRQMDLHHPHLAVHSGGDQGAFRGVSMCLDERPRFMVC